MLTPRVPAVPLQPEQVRALHERCHVCPRGHANRSHCPFFRLSLLSYATRCTVLDQLTREAAISLFRLAEEAGCRHARAECELLFGPDAGAQFGGAAAAAGAA